MDIRHHSRLATTLLLAAATTACASPGRPSGVDRWEAFAVRFGTLARFPMRALVAGGDSARRIDGALMVWPLRAADGDIVLVDAGFTREKFITQWKPVDYVTPDSALRRAGFDPGRVTDIIISHIHWDHADGVERFPRARIWLQRQEFEYYVGADGSAKDRAIDPEVAKMYRRLFDAGRIRFAEGDSAPIRPGIRVYTGGKHTFASQYVGVETPAGRVVIASDNAYLYENLERHRPIAQTLDSLSNLAAHARMQRLAAPPRLVVPGHDPAVFERFPAAGMGAVAIR
ncbi:MAG TPA: N-acyl homoserine lactonase family protein [Gemmatimonadaceae bacterium]|nr:N-acyl homoserine lactonase family protein [Gemmatimonadaceae bacterium]